MLPDDSGDQEDLAVAGQQQSSEEQAELQGSALQETHHQPEEAEHTAAERPQLYKNHRRTSSERDGWFYFFPILQTNGIILPRLASPNML